MRGYPYSLRGGVPTVLSHGLWLNAPDYNASTQLLKARERNQRYVDATITVPYKILYSMCSMNVAFNRKLIGPAFMQGLMGDGQPWARYDDMFAGRPCGAAHTDQGGRIQATQAQHRGLLAGFALYISFYYAWGRPALSGDNAAYTLANIVRTAPHGASKESLWRPI